MREEEKSEDTMEKKREEARTLACMISVVRSPLKPA
jgi:hypothetical protein